MRTKSDKTRLKSVDNIYANGPKLCKTPRKPAIRGVLPPISVDNHVESVDFCARHAVYIQNGLYIFDSGGRERARICCGNTSADGKLSI